MSKQKNEHDDDDDKIRIDKWLWAARFYKTRSLSKQAIDGGKIHCDGQRIKPSKEVTVGLVLTIRQDLDEKIVVVKALSAQRRGAPEAALLYEETEEIKPSVKNALLSVKPDWAVTSSVTNAPAKKTAATFTASSALIYWATTINC